MPITIMTGDMKYRDSLGNYHGLEGIRGETGPQGPKGDKGDTGDPAPASEVAPAVEDWLEENIVQETGYVLDRSLLANNAAAPADLVGDLKNDLSDVLYVFSNTDFEIGNIGGLNTGNWSYVSNDTYVRTKQNTVLHLSKGTIISIGRTDSALMSIGYITSEGAYGYQAFTKEDYVCPVTADYAILMKKAPSATTIIDANEVTQYLKIKNRPTLSEIQKELDYAKYTASDVAQLNTLNDVFNKNYSNFECGNINISNSGWTYSSDTTRVRTKEGTTIHLPVGAKIGLRDFTAGMIYLGWKKADNTYGKTSNWLTSEYTTVYEGDYVILINNNSNQVNSVDDVINNLNIILPNTVRNSIQSLQGRITESENEIDKIKTNIGIITSDNFEIGNIGGLNTGNWSYVSNDTYVRTKQNTSLYLAKGTVISIGRTSSALMSIGFVSSNGAYGYQSLTNEDYICPLTANYAIIIKKSSGTTITDVDEVCQYLSVIEHPTRPEIRDELDRANYVAKDVADLNALNSVYTKDFSIFECGNINISNSGWTYTAENSRVRTKENKTIHLPAGAKVKLRDFTAGTIYLGWKKSDNTYGKTSNWLSSEYTTVDEGDYVILINNFVQVVSVSDVVSNLVITLPADTTMSDAIAALQDRTTDVESDIADIEEIIKNSGHYDETNISPQWNDNGNILYCYIDVTGIKAIKYTLPNDLKLSVELYNANGGLLRNTGFRTGNSLVLCGGAPAAKVNVRKIDESAIDVSDLATGFSLDGYGKASSSYDGVVYTICHRGLSTVYPEATKSAYIAAAKAGFKYVETDVRETSDGVAVLLHDETINRTARNADGSTLEETVNIADITYEEALEYDFGIWKGSQFAGEKILRFDEFCDICARWGLYPVIELKRVSNAGSLFQTAIRHGLRGHIAWLSSAPQTHMASLTTVDSAVEFWYLASLDQTNLANILTYKTANNKIVFDTAYNQLLNATDEVINNALDNDISIAVWGLDDETQITALAEKHCVTGYTTDGYDAGLGVSIL